MAASFFLIGSNIHSQYYQAGFIREASRSHHWRHEATLRCGIGAIDCEMVGVNDQEKARAEEEAASSLLSKTRGRIGGSHELTNF
jgi:hypothetical protein